MRLLVTCLVLVSSFFAQGQRFSYPAIPTSGESMASFAPNGWTILDSTTGDLNRDGIPDAAVILQYKDSINISNGFADTVLTQPRILVVLFNQPSDKGFVIAEQSRSFILNHDSPFMEDPFEDVCITKGVLEIKFHLFYTAGSWYVTNAVYKFQYRQRCFALIGADKYSLHRATHDFEEVSYNFLSKRRTLTVGNEDSGTRKTSHKSLPTYPLQTFKTFDKPFSWQLKKDVYL